jgi:sugar phosphate isomerase/epimerase
MQINGHDMAVCSWSLKITDAAELAGSLRDLRLSHVHLAVGPLLAMSEGERKQYAHVLADADITITSTMIAFPGEDYGTIARIRQTGGFGLDELWSARRDAAIVAGLITREMGVRRLSTHIGFVPHASEDRARYVIFLSRCREVANALGKLDVQLLLETGQEPAALLLEFLRDVARPNLLVNFDPANMILYGAGDPIAAVNTLANHIGHVHIKDATPSKNPGVDWGEEVCVGTGAVPWRTFLRTLKQIGYDGPLAIEREAGSARRGDVAKAIEVLKSSCN